MRSGTYTTRHQDLVDLKELRDGPVVIVGAGAIGSFTALTLAKMGVEDITVYDDDGVSEENISNQFYRINDIRQYKVDALQSVLLAFAGVNIKPIMERYTAQPLSLRGTVIAAVDSMSARRTIWEQFVNQAECVNYIEARMGAELGQVFTLRKPLRKEDIAFYDNENILYPDSKVAPLPCTAKSIIYNVLMIASLICRSYKAIINKEDFPNRQIFDMEHITKASYAIQKAG